MEEQAIYDREQVKTELSLETETLEELIRELGLEIGEDRKLSQKQFEVIKQYHYFLDNDYRNVIEDEMNRSGLSRQEAIKKLYEDLKTEDENENELVIKHTLKSIKAEIEGNLERPVKLSELEIILELSHLSLEDEYTSQQKQAINKGLIKYLNQKSKEGFPSSDEEAIEMLIEKKSAKMAENMSETIVETITETETYYKEMVKKTIPQRMLLQFSRLDQQGIIDEKLELAREKIAQQNRLNGKPTTIEIALTTDGQKQLPMKSASVEENGDEKQG